MQRIPPATLPKAGLQSSAVVFPYKKPTLTANAVVAMLTPHRHANFAAMRNNIGQVFLHITSCIAFLSLPVLLSPDVSWNFNFIKVGAFREDFVSYALLLLFFYLNYFVLIPRFFFKQKFVFYFFCIIASYAVVALLPEVLVPGNHVPGFRGDADHTRFNRPLIMHRRPQLPPQGAADKMGSDNQQRPINAGPAFQPRPSLNQDTAGGFFPPQGNPLAEREPPQNRRPRMLDQFPRFEYLFQFMMVLVLSAMIRVNNRLKQSEKEKVNAELSYLKAQINPHFLFNTLNTIYASAIDEQADNTATAVVKLSGMMRYVISEAHHDYVSLEKELNYIADYIDLQRLRLGDTVQLSYKVSGQFSGKRIAPLILISFIENAFKHGVNPEENSNIQIRITIQPDTLELLVRNNKVNTVNGDRLNNNVGLENTTSRLQLLYPFSHQLTIDNNEKNFSVLLTIKI